MLISSDILKKFIKDVFVKLNVPDEDADICADVVIKADIFGIESHGISRFKMYCDRIKSGVQLPITNLKIIKETETTAVIDAGNGMGQVAAFRSMNLAIEKAKKYGLGAVAVRNSNHFGIAGYYALQASKQGMIGIVTSNARPSVAPTFGVEPIFGTNPIAVAIPTNEEFDFLFDAATSIIQRGEIELYARENKLIPESLTIDEQGNYCTDPVKFLQDIIDGKSAFLPLGGKGEDFGGHKGYGLAIIVEMLCSALQDGKFLKDLSGVKNGKKIPHQLGHFFMAINISNFIPLEHFKKITTEIIHQLRNSKKIPGANRIYVAGEKEYEIMKLRLKEGIPISENLLQELKTIKQEFNLVGYNFEPQNKRR